MYSMFNISTSGMSAFQNKINAISNNIVNINTKGYKKVEVEFEDSLRLTLDRDYYPLNYKNATMGGGSRITSEVRNSAQGALLKSDIVSALAIDGKGVFRVITKDNTYAYTRNGEFNIDIQGKIEDDNGNVLDIQFENDNNYTNLNITKDNLKINKQGVVFVDDKRVGKINLYTSKGNGDFIDIGENLFIPKEGTEINIENNSHVIQGYVEMSNVNIQQEFTDLTAVQRAFQLSSEGIKVADDMWSMINNLQSR